MNKQFCFRIHMDELIEEAEGGIWDIILILMNAQ